PMGLEQHRHRRGHAAARASARGFRLAARAGIHPGPGGGGKMSFTGTSLAFALLTAATESAPESRAKELDEVARVATVMIDGDLCLRIMPPRALDTVRPP